MARVRAGPAREGFRGTSYPVFDHGLGHGLRSRSRSSTPLRSSITLPTGAPAEIFSGGPTMYLLSIA